MKIKGIVVLMLVLSALTGIIGIAAAREDSEGGGGGQKEAPVKHLDIAEDKISKSKVVYYYAEAYAENYNYGKEYSKYGYDAFKYIYSYKKDYGVYCYSQAGPGKIARAYCKYVNYWDSDWY